jgi:hypothetical protein
MPKVQRDETDLFIPYLCDRCHEPLEGGGLCHECRRKFFSQGDGRSSKRRSDDSISPWQENAIRVLEDQA